VFRDLPGRSYTCVSEGRNLRNGQIVEVKPTAPAPLRTSIALRRGSTRGGKVWKKPHRSSVGNIGAAVDRRFSQASGAATRSHEEDLLSVLAGPALGGDATNPPEPE